MANPNPSPETRLSETQTHCDPEDKLSPLAQLKRMQRILYKTVMDESTERRLLPQCACAWEKLEGRKAALTMKPAPKPVDVTELHRARERRRAEAGDGQAPGWRGKPRSTPAPVAQVIHMPVDNSPAADQGPESAAK